MGCLKTAYRAENEPVLRCVWNVKKQPKIHVNCYDYGARFYDPAIGRFTTQDPLASDFPSWTPYHYVHNNPIILIDPTGMFASPIYGVDGNFLGTDDEGLQGQALVMNEEDFEQGMSHDEALNNNLGAKGLTDLDAASNLHSHYDGLKDRPDYDGVLTFGEVTKWSNEGSGEPLFVDGSKIDLSPINVSDVKKASENGGYIDFLKDGKISTGSVYGNIKVTLSDERTGTVILGGKNGYLDKHDFSNPNFERINDVLYPDTPKDFLIYCAPCGNKVSTK